LRLEGTCQQVIETTERQFGRLDATVANVVLDRASSYMTGAELVIDGISDASSPRRRYG